MKRERERERERERDRLTPRAGRFLSRLMAVQQPLLPAYSPAGTRGADFATWSVGKKTRS